eukprot:jgi/Galph1/533/GphlegSOOS_G5180.1
MKHGYIESLHPIVLLTLAIFSLSLAAVSSGLTQGIFTLSTLELEVMAASGSSEDSEYARKILPLRKRSNLVRAIQSFRKVLTTLLVASTVAQELLPLTVYPLIPHGIYPLVISAGALFLFGNIVPEAICLRHGLKVAGYFSSFVKLLVIVCWPISFPLSKAIDMVIGNDYTRILSRVELKTLFDLYERHKYKVLTSDEYHIVKDIMTPAEHVFMLNVDQKLDKKLTREIAKNGHSRIPLYDGNRNNVVALLLVKGLISYNPSEKLPIRVFISKHSEDQLVVTAPLYVSGQTNLETMLGEFQRGHSHMAIVYDKPYDEKRKFLGVITLEDVIEEILQEEIIDETDQYQDMTSMKPVSRLIVKGFGRKLQNRSSSFFKQSRLSGEGYITIKETDLRRLLQGSSRSTDSPRHFGEVRFSSMATKEEQLDKTENRRFYQNEGIHSLPNIYGLWQQTELEGDAQWLVPKSNEDVSSMKETRNQAKSKRDTKVYYASSAPEEYSLGSEEYIKPSSPCSLVPDENNALQTQEPISCSYDTSSIYYTEDSEPFLIQNECCPLLSTSAPEQTDVATPSHPIIDVKQSVLPYYVKRYVKEHEEESNLSPKSYNYSASSVSIPIPSEENQAQDTSRKSFESLPRSRRLLLSSFLRRSNNISR